MVIPSDGDARSSDQVPLATPRPDGAIRLLKPGHGGPRTVGSLPPQPQTPLSSGRWVLEHPLDERELQRRAAKIRLVLTDCDGVLTDAGVYYSEAGEAMKRFSLRDGMGVERLREAGIETAIVTRERSGAVLRRAEKLSLPFHFAGVLDKRAHLPAILEATERSLAEVAYIGDDVNDAGIMEAVGEEGLVGAPSDAFEAVLGLAHFVGHQPGGHGAFREFAEWIIEMKRNGAQSWP